MELACGIAQRSEPGFTYAAAFDGKRRLQIVLPLDLVNTTLLEWVELFCRILKPGEALLLVSNRTGEVPADRPTDETEWEKLAAVCAREDVTLLDWWVSSGRYGFSIAEFSSTPSGWPSWGIESVFLQPI